MSAAEIASALGDDRYDGRDIKCRCPLCGGRLALRDGERGLLAWCFGGCEARAVYACLRRLGYLSGEPPAPLQTEERERQNAAAERDRRRKIALARDIWDQAQKIEGTLGDHYLRVARGVDVLSPYIGEAAAHALRYLPRAWHSPGIYLPAIAAAIKHVEYGLIGCHVTYLAVDGSGKTTLDPPRKVFGACKGGAVRLGKPKLGQWFIIGEGLETVFAVMQACALPGWAALSALGIKNLALPPEAGMVVIAADNDGNGVGQRAAYEAAERFLSEGRRVRIALPPLGLDFNDLLLGQIAGVVEKVRNAAA